MKTERRLSDHRRKMGKFPRSRFLEARVLARAFFKIKKKLALFRYKKKTIVFSRFRVIFVHPNKFPTSTNPTKYECRRPLRTDITNVYEPRQKKKNREVFKTTTFGWFETNISLTASQFFFKFPGSFGSRNPSPTTKRVRKLSRFSEFFRGMFIVVRFAVKTLFHTFLANSRTTFFNLVEFFVCRFLKEKKTTVNCTI